MTVRTGRWIAWAAIGWTSLYVVSKVHFALEGRLGVTGGPRVAPEEYLGYGPGQVALAQWGNAASGLIIISLLAVSLAPVRRRLWRRMLLVLLWVCAAMAAAGAVGMTGGALLSDRGGALFGAYCVVWAVLLGLAALAFQRRGQVPSAQEPE
ncbi:hypothetical protein HS048_24660 [Planomonospora sp. ID91781]|uniref:hypothetical protein n=1 Tax=Planomonospora sp. ID91781 TaxID=2738135 RepID=UPI0018C4147A|nr:hypothetical protein [Planomonospora sp. ID91781]MBG0823914.1 hypothetical protein [Planomonospora sp. ID91781]